MQRCQWQVPFAKRTLVVQWICQFERRELLELGWNWKPFGHLLVLLSKCCFADGTRLGLIVCISQMVYHLSNIPSNSKLAAHLDLVERKICNQLNQVVIVSAQLGRRQHGLWYQLVELWSRICYSQLVESLRRAAKSVSWLNSTQRINLNIHPLIILTGLPGTMMPKVDISMTREQRYIVCFKKVDCNFVVNILLYNTRLRITRSVRLQTSTTPWPNPYCRPNPNICVSNCALYSVVANCMSPISQ